MTGMSKNPVLNKQNGWVCICGSNTIRRLRVLVTEDVFVNIFMKWAYKGGAERDLMGMVSDSPYGASYMILKRLLFPFF